MKGLKKTVNDRFEYYLRQCNDCDKLFKAKAKKCKYCSECKKDRNAIRITNSLTARGIAIKEGFKMIDDMIDCINKTKEVNNEYTKLDSKSRYFS